MRQEKIPHLSLRELFEDLSSMWIGFAFATVFALASIIAYMQGMFSFIILRAILFLYALGVFLISFKLYHLVKVKELAKEMGFRLITPFYLQARIEGTYKDKWWQIHYRSKETGKDPGVLRTYIKLQWKEKKTFDENILAKYHDKEHKGQNIIVIKHIIRPYKNYLLLKRRGFTFDKHDIYDLMDLLLKVADKANIKD